MTLVVDARDVDHVIETMEATLQCENEAVGHARCSAVEKDPCGVCVSVGLLRQAARFDAEQVPF